MEILSNPKHDYLEEKMEEKDTELGRGGWQGERRGEEEREEKESFYSRVKSTGME